MLWWGSPPRERLRPLFTNTANSSGGGIYNDYKDTLTLTNSTVSGNTANKGGGIYNYGSHSTNLSFSTLTLNGATGTGSAGGGIYIASGTVKLKGVILAGNTSSGSGPECKGSLTSQGYNLIGSNAGCGFTAQTTDITGQDPALGDLADNGGPTQTHLPEAGSPVLNQVPPADCTTLGGTPLSTDQRGVSRPQGTHCDIGSVEVEQ